ncbi:MAG TPA: tetratricopeptide repeat protein [Pyrinomonadaceae bacterium]|nr:tetratricopeptide repeat protein [Pyrinomonadaceae bacterium]
MDASPDLWTSLLDLWGKLREGVRDNIIADIIVVVLVALAGIFRKALLSGIKALYAGIKRLFSNPPSPELPPPARHEVVIKVETPQPSPAPTQHTPPLPSQPEPNSTVSLPEIPRHPVGFVPRRDKEDRDILNILRGTLAPRDNQLVTLYGPGGVGKTRLAVEATRPSGEAFAQRVVWASADGRPDFKLSTLLDSVALQLGRRDLLTLAPEAKDEQVRALVVESPTLVVLDNFETIVPDEQRLIEAWFAKAQCSALFTSRDKITGTIPIYVPGMKRDEAEEFLSKVVAQTQDPQVFTPDVRERVYEMAEANPHVMQWIVGQIDEARVPGRVFEELAVGEGAAAERVFERSFKLPQLGDDGRDALLALSLFAPSAPREALAEVAGFGNDWEKRLDMAVKSLHALWLAKGVDGNRRLTVEGLTRSMAASRLSKDPRGNEFRRRFVAYFLRYAVEREEPAPENYDALEVEKDNLLGASEVAFASGDWGSVTRMAYALARGATGMLSVRGYWGEAVKFGEQALQAARALQDEGQIAGLSHNLAIMYQNRGEVAEARRLFDESLEITRRLGYQGVVASTLYHLSILAQEQGELEQARRLLDESLEIAKRLGDQGGVAIVLHQLAILAQGRGELKEAHRLYDESLEIEKRLGNQSGIAISLHQLGRLAEKQSEIVEARRFYDESLEIKRRLGNQGGVALTLHALGRLAEKEGDNEGAARLFRESLSIFERLDSPHAEIARRSLARVGGEGS